MRSRYSAYAVGEDTVAFRAHWVSPQGDGVLRERSRVVRRGGRWVYLEGVLS